MVYVRYSLRNLLFTILSRPKGDNVDVKTFVAGDRSGEMIILSLSLSLSLSPPPPPLPLPLITLLLHVRYLYILPCINPML